MGMREEDYVEGDWNKSEEGRICVVGHCESRFHRRGIVEKRKRNQKSEILYGLPN